MSAEELDKAFKEMDPDGDGEVTFAEFEVWCARCDSQLRPSCWSVVLVGRHRLWLQLQVQLSVFRIQHLGCLAASALGPQVEGRGSGESDIGHGGGRRAGSAAGGRDHPQAGGDYDLHARSAESTLCVPPLLMAPSCVLSRVDSTAQSTQRVAAAR